MATGGESTEGDGDKDYIDLGGNGIPNKELGMEKEEQKLKILVIGKKGAGKTMLVKSFVAHEEDGTREEKKHTEDSTNSRKGEDSSVGKDGDSNLEKREDPCLEKDKDSVVGKKEDSSKDNLVEVSSTVMCGNILEFYDTVGLSWDKAGNKKLFQQINNEIPDGFNVALVCIRMDDEIDKSLVNALLEVSNVYGNEFWDRAIFVFTFANIYTQTVTPDNELKHDVCLNQQIDILIDQLQKQLVEDPRRLYSVKKDSFESIPRCMAGLSGRGNPADLILPTTQDWLQDLLLACISQSTVEPITASLLDKDKKRLLMEAGGVGATAAVGGATGAVIGGTIGTIMLPVVGTVVGAGIGSLIGGGIGTVASTSTVVGIRISDKNKEEEYNAAEHIRDRGREIFANVKTKLEKFKKPSA